MKNMGQSLISYFSEKTTAWWSSLLFLLAVSLYWPSLFNGFVWDDINLIVNNSFLQGAKDVTSLTSSDNVLRMRPLYSLSLYLDYHIWGLRPFGYHFENIVLHGLNTVLLYLLLSRLFSKKLSIVASLIFAVHAVNSEAVDWILNRSGLLSTLFSLISLNLYFSARKTGYRIQFYLASLVFYIFAILTKEAAVILPGIILGYEALFSTDKKLWRKIFYTALPLFFILLLYFWWWSHGAILNVFRVARYWGGSPYNTFLLMMKAVADYLRLLVFPLDLQAWYIADKNVSVMNPHVLAGMILLVVLIFAVFRYRKKNPIISFSIGWFIVGLLPVSNIIPITGSMMAERWLYFPMIGFCIAAGAGFEYLYDKKLALNNKFRTIIVVVFCLFLSLHSVRTYERHKHWLDTETMFKDLLVVNPYWAPGHNVLAVVYQHEGRYKKGLVEVLKAIELDPDYSLSYETLGSLLVDANRLAEAEVVFRKFYELKPTAQTGHVNFSIALMHQGKFTEAKEALETALKINPNDMQVHINFGYLHYIMDDFDRAEAAVNKVLGVSPDNIEAIKLIEAIKAKKSKLIR